jgi:hypothetical protein
LAAVARILISGWCHAMRDRPCLAVSDVCATRPPLLLLICVLLC